MPPTRKRTSTTTKPTTKRTKSVTKSTKSTGTYRVNVPKSLVNLGSGFPRMTKIIHKYTENASVSNASINGSVQFWSCNGMYDPTSAVGGHQPYYFDQMSALYNHYVVIGSKATFWISAGNGNVVPIQYNVGIDDDTTIPTNGPVYLAETTDGNYGHVIPNTNTTVVTQTWSAKKYFGKDPLDNTELQGTGSSNPTEQSWYYITVQPLNGTSTGQEVWITIQIEYIAIWKELKTLPAS